MLRRIAQVVLVVATLVVAALATAVIVSQTSWFKNWLRGVIVRQAGQYLNGTLSIDRVGGNLFSGVELEGVGLEVNGRPTIEIKDAGIEYHILQILSGNVVIQSIRLNEPVIHVRRGASGWNLGQLVKQQRQEKTRKGPGRSVTLGEIGVSDGQVVLDSPVGTSGLAAPQALDKIDARLSFSYEPVHYTVDIAHLSFRGASPAIDLNALSGKVSVRNGTLFFDRLAVRTAQSSFKVQGAIEDYAVKPALNLQVTSDKFALPEMSQLIPALAGMPLEPAFRVSTRGPLDNLAMTVALRSSAGDVSGPLTADFVSPVIRLKGNLHVNKLNLAPILKSAADTTDITGQARFDLGIRRSPAGTTVSGPYEVNAEHVAAFGYEARNVQGRGRVDGTTFRLDVRALAYGANATAAGVISVPRGRPGHATVTYDLTGRVGNGDLRQLPRQLHLPRVASRLDLDYHVAGAGAAVQANVTLRPSDLLGAKLGANTTGTLSLNGKDVSYGAKGAVSGLDLQRVGQGFNIEALKAQQYRSSISGVFDVRGSGTALDTLVIDATGHLSNSEVYEGAKISDMAFDARLARRRLDLTARGQFANLNPAVVTGTAAAAASLNGRVDGRLTLTELGQPVFPDRLAFDGAVDLGRSTVGKMPIAALSLLGKYTNRVADVARLNVKGADLSASASGRLLLANEGDSNLTLHVESSRLSEIGKLVGQPLNGAALLDARVTGNGTLLHAEGRLEASGAEYGTTASALKFASTFGLDVPDLDPGRLRATADTSGTFVQVAGQGINEVHAKTTYDGQRVGFDLNLREMPRNLEAAGDLLLHPDHGEVHLDSLVLRSQGQQWQIAPGTAPAVQYGGGNISVQGLRLVSGSQQLSVAGTIGNAAAEGLQATATGVDLAQLDALTLGNHGLAGRLDARATIKGPVDALSAAGDFTVTGGGFRTFRYQSLGGKVQYARDAVSLDVRLEQNPATWIAARGRLPLALFRGLPPGSPALADRVDLQVQSSLLDLGIIQGFTDQLQKVSGTLQANLNVSGTVANPETRGHLDIRNGAFTVVPTGVSYKGLEGGILLLPRQLVVEGLRVMDDHGQALSLGGQLGVEARQIGAVNLQVQSQGLKVLDNEYGKARVKTNLTVSGEMTRPEVRGDIDLDTGQVDLDAVLERAVSSAYSTTPAGTGGAGGAGTAGTPAVSGPRGLAPSAAPSAAASAAAAPEVPAPAQVPAMPAPTGLYNGLTLNVRLRVPNDLVVKGQNLRVGTSPVGLGAVNVTIGGDVRAVKKPGDFLRLTGQVNTVRGTYDFQGRRFDILRNGVIRFEGLRTINPTLNITARRVISGVQADVHVRGSLRRPELTLTSEPPLEEADILSLIIFNQPANELGQGQQVSLAQRASALATGFVASKIADSIGRALNLDVFEISTEPEPGAGTGAGATVTIGQQVGQRLYVKLRQGVGADNLSQFVLDYQIADYARLETTMSQGANIAQSLLRRSERGGVDLIFFFSY